MNLRKAARGRPCQIRIPGVCNHDPDTSVLCHFNHFGIAGMAQKSPDLIAAIGCSDCHAAVDRQRRKGNDGEVLDYNFVVECHMAGVMRTQALWVSEGFVSW